MAGPVPVALAEVAEAATLVVVEPVANLRGLSVAWPAATNSTRTCRVPNGHPGADVIRTGADAQAVSVADVERSRYH